MGSVMFEMGTLGVESSAQEPDDRRIGGVAAAMVISNKDSTGEARVQLMIPWLPGFFPWARVTTMMSGIGYGSYWVPQEGDEVLVAFSHGDVREAYVIGSLWSTIARPHEVAPDAPYTKRSIRTPSGHTISFDEKGSVTISSGSFDSVTLGLDGIEISTVAGGASISLSKKGDLTLSALKSITLDAPSITIGGTKTADATVRAKTQLTLDGGAACAVSAKRIDLN